MSPVISDQVSGKHVKLPSQKKNKNKKLKTHGKNRVKILDIPTGHQMG